MRHKFLITDNVSRLVNGLGEMEERVRAGSERGLGIMEGRTGTGKTWAGEWYIVNHPPGGIEAPQEGVQGHVLNILK